MFQTHAKKTDGSENNLKIKKSGDATSLLKDIRRASLQIETNNSVYANLDKDNIIYYTYKQGREESSTKYLGNFKSIIEAVKNLDGTIFADNALINCKMKEDNNKGEQRKSDNEYKKIIRGKMIGFALIKRANRKSMKLLTSIR